MDERDAGLDRSGEGGGESRVGETVEGGGNGVTRCGRPVDVLGQADGAAGVTGALVVDERFTFSSEPLVYDQGAGYARCTIRLTEYIDGSAAPSYSIASTLNRFPDSTLATALTAPVQTCIPLIHIKVRLSGYPDNLYFSDRRCT